MSYNLAMVHLRRPEGPLVAVLSVALVVSVLLPVSPWTTADPSRQSTLRLQSPRELLVAGPPFSIDCDLVLFSSRSLQGNVQNTNRPHLAIIPPRLEVIPVASFESPSARHVPKLLWCKNRRYVCQILDLPPPFPTASCAL